jgi:hypothetical protein
MVMLYDHIISASERGYQSYDVLAFPAGEITKEGT